MNGFRLLAFCLWLLTCIPVNASPFMDTSVGLAFYNIEVDENSSISSVGEYAGFSIGQRFKHSLAASLSMRLWNTSDEDDGDADVNHALLHEFHFAGISLGAEAQIFLPLQSHGPYAKFGRHCWGASAEDVLNVWSGSGCSNIAGGGILMEGANSDGASGLFAEVLLTRFKFVHSWMLVFGARF